jgi:pimeloyl-ACP methyl ester carboxylesterase
MSFWRSLPGTVLLVLALACLLALGVVSLQVHRVTHPPRHGGSGLDVAGDLVRVEEAAFEASDGTRLAGWRMPGRPSMPAILLCHDRGQTKASQVNLGLALQQAGFTVMAFDFRGHGDSEGGASTLGIEEKRDVLGAIDHLAARPGLGQRRIGVYGVGMGAHAAVLAAADRQAMKVLVLDGLYPNVGFPLHREVFEGWAFGTRNLGFLPDAVFGALHFSVRDEPSAGDVLPRLLGRDLLLVAPEGDAALSGAMHRMYETIPEQRDTDGNLVVVPASSGHDLYGGDLTRYHSRIRAFFEHRLSPV